MSGAWHGAWLTAYAPKKPTSFPKLRQLMRPLETSGSRAARRGRVRRWEEDFKAMQTFVRATEGRSRVATKHRTQD